MKAFEIYVVVAVAVLNICSARVFNEKQDAIKEIDAKFAEANKTRNNIIASLTNEKKALNASSDVDTVKHLRAKTQETRDQLDKEVTAVIRTAIVKAKPISVIHCIRNIALRASKNITELDQKLLANITGIKKQKAEKINLDEYSVDSIIKGLKELLEQAKTKINSNSEPIPNVKKDALGHCRSTMILMGDIEIQIHEPILSILYIKMRHEIDRTYREFQVQLENVFKGCVN